MAKPENGELERVGVLLDEEQKLWLRRIKGQALLDGQDVSASAVMRFALVVLAQKYPSWKELQPMLPAPPKGGRARGRPRR